MEFLNVIIEKFSNVELALTSYIIAISIIAFVMMAFDKRRAKKGEWRVREATLIVVSFLGGAIGSLIGMVVFKHKINKRKFYLGIPAIYLINRIVETLLLLYLG